MTREEAIMILRNSITFRTLRSDELLALDMAIEALKEPKKGEWITAIDYDAHGSKYQYCSICRYEKPSPFDKFRFCPNCGAEMRVKDELNRVSKELNSEIENLKSEIVPDYRDGWRMKEGDEK